VTNGFGGRAPPGPAGGASALLQTPSRNRGFGHTSRGREGRAREGRENGRRKERERERKKREMKGEREGEGEKTGREWRGGEREGIGREGKRRGLPPLYLTSGYGPATVQSSPLLPSTDDIQHISRV